MTRSKLFVVSLGVAFTLGALPDLAPPAEAGRARKARAKKPRKRRIRKHHLSLVNANTGERINNLHLIWEDPKDRSRKFIRKTARKRIRHFFRDRRTKKSRNIHDRLIWYLYIVGYHYDRPVTLISGYRSGARKTSRHRQGRAADLRIDGVPVRKLWQYSKRFKKMGLGLYPTSRFIHIDVRDRSYYWIDDSGPGEDAEYRSEVAQPLAELRAQQARDRRRKKRKK